MGDLLAHFLERDRITYLYVRSEDGWRTTVQETWGGSMQSGLQFYGSCAASLRGAYVKKAERKMITTHSQGGYIWWNSTLKANSNKLLSEATLHFNLCVLLAACVQLALTVAGAAVLTLRIRLVPCDWRWFTMDLEPRKDLQMGMADLNALKVWGYCCHSDPGPNQHLTKWEIALAGITEAQAAGLKQATCAC